MLSHAVFNRLYLLALLVVVSCTHVTAQVINNNQDPTTQQNSMFNQGKDSTIQKQKEEWKEEHARIYYNNLNSIVVRYPDTTLENFHRYQPVQPWWVKDLGNSGSAARNLFFTPAIPTGLSLGYHIYDVYRLTLDSLKFYNTTRPYSAFAFMLASKSEQNVEILHTQNITPLWNFAGRLRYFSSAGFYKLQKTNSISSSFSSNYQSKNKRYYMALGFVYNRHKQNENGGIVSDTLLENSKYADRQLIDVNLPPVNSSSKNAAVVNTLRDLDFYVQNNYSFGRTDTVYTKDSSGVSYNFTPRFRIKHQLQLHSENHTYKDMDPETNRYKFIDSIPFNAIDTLYGSQNWFYVDNKFSLNGFLGKASELVQIEAGIGNRIDRFSTKYVSGEEVQNSVGNYIFGEIKKEATQKGQWNYLAAANFFFTGDATGNFDISGSVGKDLNNIGMFSAGLRQNLSNAPYAFTSFKTNFFNRSFSFDKTSITQLWAKVQIDKIGVQLGIKNNLIANYLYYDQTLSPKQESEAFSLLQIFGRKEFRFGIFVLDNEVAWQQTTGNAPVHVPAFLLRHKLGLITPMFKSALIVALGLEAKYHTPYYADGYTAYFNQFYYQDTYKVSNAPEVQAFFNFKIKTFRAFVVIDQLQQYFSRNIINAPGYPAQDAMFKFGFTWILIN
ncbi:MAG: putative porin [Taibaiella sp.]